METEARYEKFLSSNVHIQNPDWEWDPTSAWNCPSEQDLRVWVSTVLYSNLNVSVSSSVTLEYAVLGKPVVNICFDLPSQLPTDQSNRRFWDAPFYEEIRQKQLAIPVMKADELKPTLQEVLFRDKKQVTSCDWLQENAVDNIIKDINSL
jgi:hypothetical protein